MAVALAALMSVRRLDDFDTWWHLAAGRWIVRNGSVPSTDVLSFTVPDHSWTNLQWLYDVILYGLYGMGGADLLVVTAAACYAAAFALCAANVRRSLGPLATCLLVVAITAAAAERFLIRPEMATFVLLALVAWIVDDARAGSGRRLWLLVPLMVLWVNLHALFVLGVMVIAAAMAAAVAAELPLLPPRWREASKLEPQRRRQLLLAGGASIAATVCNPYLLEGVFFPLELFTRIDGTGTSAFQAIGEFRPPFSGYFPTLAIGAYQALFVVGGAVVIIAGVLEAFPGRRRREPARFDIAGLAVFVALAYLSTLARRNLGIFAIGAAPFLARCLAIIGERAPSGLREAARKATTAATVAIPVILICSAAMIATSTWYARSGQAHEFGAGVFEANFPIHAASFMREQELPGPVFNDLTAGGYLTWADPTGGGVYIDGRLEVYDDEFFSRYMGTLGDFSAWRSDAEKFGIQSVLLFHRWGNRHGLIRLLAKSQEWSLVYYDEVAVIFVRRAGNEETVGAAAAAFAVWDAKTAERLKSPPRAFGWAVERYTALHTYASLLATLGNTPKALEMYERALEVGLPPATEVTTRMRVARYLAYSGQLSQARMHLGRARKLDPANANVADMLRRLDQTR